MRIVIADDEPLARERLRLLLADQPDAEVVAEAGDGHAALQACADHDPDLVLLDIALACADGLLRIQVGNPVPDNDAGAGRQAGARHAQHSIGDRLAHAFGPRAGLTIDTRPGYYRCELRVPT